MELNWLQFKIQSHIRTLNENEQVRQYHFYLDSLANERIRQNKGPRRPRLITTGFLLQENLSLLQQEDGSAILITDLYG